MDNDSEVPTIMLAAVVVSSGALADSSLDNIPCVLIVNGPERMVCRQSSVLCSKQFLMRQI
jgi:hypothetical protein